MASITESSYRSSTKSLRDGCIRKTRNWSGTKERKRWRGAEDSRKQWGGQLGEITVSRDKSLIKRLASQTFHLRAVNQLRARPLINRLSCLDDAFGLF